MSFILITDLEGKYNISQSRYGEDDINSIIDSVEKSVLKQLLGDDLYLKLMADCTGNVPATQEYTDLVYGKTYSVKNADNIDVNIQYEGIKPMLMCFIYAEVLKAQQSQNSQVGEIIPEQNNSSHPANNRVNIKIQQSYNEGVGYYGKDIQFFASSDSFIRGRRFRENIKNYTEFDYWKEYLKGTCFNFLYNYKTSFSTWQFTPKSIMGFNGWL